MKYFLKFCIIAVISARLWPEAFGVMVLKKINLNFFNFPKFNFYSLTKSFTRSNVQKIMIANM
jgi:hypothetical protein